MTPEDIRELVRKSYAAYDNRDQEFILNLFDDNIEWKYFSSPEAIPFPNHVRGKLQVLMALKAVDDLFETVGNTLELVMVDGDRAAVICDQKVRQRATGRIYPHQSRRISPLPGRAADRIHCVRRQPRHHAADARAPDRAAGDLSEGRMI